MPIQIRRFASRNAIKLELIISGPALQRLRGQGTVREAALHFAQCLKQVLEDEVESNNPFHNTGHGPITNL